jgi:hypothetical protein
MAALTPVAHPITLCLHCDKPVFDDNIIVTKCCHVFDRACLEGWFQRKQTCPLDQDTISLPICQPLQNYLQPFSEYYAEDKPFVISTLPKSMEDQVEKVCSICTEDEFAAVYFMGESKRFMHEACWINWIKLHPNETPSLTNLYPQQIATVERKWVESKKPSKLPLPASHPALHSSVLAPPPPSPRKPPKPLPVGMVAFLAVSPVISIWAYFMNTRVYPKNTFLFVLSIPVLLIRNIFSIASFLFKRIFIERKV